jgi:hypothetical protein
MLMSLAKDTLRVVFKKLKRYEKTNMTGFGRCQGGFCGPYVIQILERELDIPVTQVVKRSSNSLASLYLGKELVRAFH